MIDGIAYRFFMLLLPAPIAGLVLFTNSIFCLIRYHNWEPVSLSPIVVLFSGIGVLTAWYYLPQSRM